MRTASAHPLDGDTPFGEAEHTPREVSKPSSPAVVDTSSAELRQLDDLLFLPDKWFALDRKNIKIRDVSPGSLTAALELVGRGRVATIVGTLRPEVRVVDVDVADDLGVLLTENIAFWCGSRGLWHLVRESGGRRGRAHVYVIAGVHDQALAGMLAAEREQYRLGAKDLDLRRQVRPLSAPHRLTGPTATPTGLTTALSAASEALSWLPEGLLERRLSRQRATVAPIAGPREPLTPRRRARRDMPAPWQAYVNRGRAAAREVDLQPGHRSLIEQQATYQMVVAGYSEDEAWQAITGSPRTAFPKAKSRGRRWWWHQWNRAVTDADAWAAEHRGHDHHESTEGAPLRQWLEASWLTWPRRTRRVDYELASVLADLMDHHDSPALHLSQRELLLQTTIASRNTLRAALARLSAAGGIRVESSYQSGTTDTSDTVHRLAESTSEAASASPVRVIDPHSFQPPQPALPLPQRLSLGLATSQTFQHLPSAAHPGLAPAELAAAAGFCGDPSAPTPAEVRSVRRHLVDLSSLGLATVDENGLWRAAGASAPPALVRVGRDEITRRTAQIAAERREFRARLDGAARRQRWELTRVAAITSSRKALARRQKQWWHEELDAEERERRSTQRAAAFHVLPVREQAELKLTWAEGRRGAGTDERTRYEQWRRRLTAEEFSARSQEYASRFALLDPLERLEKLLALDRHRARYALPHPSSAAQVGVGATPSAGRPPSTVDDPRGVHQPAFAL